MATITEDYVSFDTAKLLKEKKFNIPCMGRYSVRSKEFHLDCTRMCGNEGLFECAAPSQAMAMKWLREKHQIFIRPNTSFIYPIRWYSEIFCYGDNLKTQQDVKTEYYNSPEEACEAAIKYCLENLI